MAARHHPAPDPANGVAGETDTRQRKKGDAGSAVQLSADGIVGTWSDAARRATGLSDSHVLGRRLDSLCLEKDLDVTFRAVRDKPVAVELTLDRGIRGNVAVEAVISAKRDSAGALTGYELRFPVTAGRPNMCRPLSNVQFAQHAPIRRLGLPDSPAFLVNAKSLHIIDWNPAAARAVGLSASELRGRTLPEIFDFDQTDKQGEGRDGQPGLSHFRLTDRGGTDRGYCASLVPVRLGGDAHALCVLNELTGVLDTLLDLGRSNEKLSRLARHDHLTGLFNKAMFEDTLQLANSRVDRSEGLLGILYIDLDGFKPVNDRYGHEVGDNLLVAVVQRLQSGLRSSDVMARLGGDEFGAILENLRRRRDALTVARHLIERLKEPFEIAGGESVKISASIGAVVTAQTVDRAASLVAEADRTMYEAKSLGRGRAALAPATARTRRRQFERRP